jgi:hypothetical protein
MSYPAWDGSIVRLIANPARTVDYLASDRLPRRISGFVPCVVESLVSQLHYLPCATFMAGSPTFPLICCREP